MRVTLFSLRGLLFGLSLAALQTAFAAEPTVTFLSGDAARATIVDDARDPYFALLQPIEMAAKTGAEIAGSLTAQRAETRKRYQAAVRSFTEAEQQALRAYVLALQPMLVHYPRFARQPWRFVKLADSIEGGLPHTRADAIILSEYVAASVVEMRQQLSAQAALMRVGPLLVHEQMHVLQRLEPARFAPLYIKVFGFVRSAPLDLPAELVANQVANPDGLGCCWLFPLTAEPGRFLLPWLAFAESGTRRKMPQDFRMRAVPVVAQGAGYRVLRAADGRVQTRDLVEVAEYVQAFSLTQNFYHPNETAADLFAQLVMHDGLERDGATKGRRRTQEKEFAPLRNWFRTHLRE